jgi:predicted SprT family Zn-dependent metalloprotease
MTSKSYERKNSEPTAITPVEYGGLQDAYEFFNRELFAGELPDIFITYQRRARSRGYFSPDRFSARIGEFDRHEVALNPDNFVDRTDEEICSTLVHEQCHVLRHQIKGKSSSYHDKAWGALMKEIGLYPSDTGKPGGKETGHRVSHYIIPSGPFAEAFTKLEATGWQLNLESHRSDKKRGIDKNKMKFSCTECGQNAWGRPDLQITCTICSIEMPAAE